MHTREVTISSNEVDPFLDLSLPGLFRLIQASAEEGAEAIGEGKSETTDKGYIWVLTRVKAEISRMPTYQEKISISTYPGEQLGCFYFRHFYAQSDDGEILFRLSSSWALLERASHKMVMRSPFPGPLPLEKQEGELGRPEKLFSQEGARLREKRRITYSMCDLNGHLNNTRYIELLVDTKGREFYSSHALSSLTINFEKEILEGEEVEIYLAEPCLDSFFIEGKVKAEGRFLASLLYKEKQR